MKRFARLGFIGLSVIFATAACAYSQQEPHVGYIYPAGGQRGTTVEVMLGGQYLDGVDGVHVSGNGIEAKVADYRKPMNPRELTELREKIQESRKQMSGSMRNRFRRGQFPGLSEMAADLGVAEEDLEQLRELRERQTDPKIQPNPQIDETVKLEVSLSKDASAGVHELRLITDRGLSNPIRFLVNSSPEHLETEPNDKTADSTIEGLPVVINGQIMPGDVDRFTFSARRGQQLVVAASARELIPYLADAVPGWFQATLALFDSSGKEVAYVDDFLFHPDPVLFYRIAETGSYTLEIKDSVYRGREDFVYRIVVGELPFAACAYPLGGREGEKTPVELLGWNLPAQTISFEPKATEAAPYTTSLASGEHIGGEVPFAVDALPESEEEEPNNKPAEAMAVKLPMIVNGRIDMPGDWDVFRFEGQKGQTIVAEVLARRLNSPLDSVLELTDADGKQLAFNDDHEDKAAGLTTHHADSRLSVDLPADGAYYLRLGDRQQGGGRAHAYRLRLSGERPDYELRVAPASVNVRAGASVPITAYAVRRDGFDGAIKLSLDGAPRGMFLSGGRIPAGQDQVRLTLTAPPFAGGEIVSPNMVGSASIGGRTVRRTAVPAEDMMQAFIYQHLVPSEELLVSVQRAPRTAAPIRLLDDDPVEIPLGGTALVRLAVPGDSFLERLKLELSNPPEGVALQRIDAKPETTILVLSADAEKAKPGAKGNLIVDLFIERSQSRDGTPQPARRFPVGVLPAIAFEVVVAKTWLDEAMEP